MNKKIILTVLLFCVSFSIFCQGGASAEFDARHAFDDDSVSGQGSGFGIIGFIVMAVLFLVVLTFFSSGKKNE